jgi:hypothetical protein
MHKSGRKKDFLEFVAYLAMTAIIHDERCRVVDHKKTEDPGTKNADKNSDAGNRSSGHNPRGFSSEGGRNMMSDRDRAKSGHGRSSESFGTRKQLAEYKTKASLKTCGRNKVMANNRDGQTA